MRQVAQLTLFPAIPSSTFINAGKGWAALCLKTAQRAFLFRLPTWFVNGVDWQLAEFKGKVMLANFLRGQTLDAMSLISNSRHATLHPYRDLGLVCLNGRLPSLVATVRTLILQSGLRPGYPGNSAPTLPRLWQLYACRGADVLATPVM